MGKFRSYAPGDVVLVRFLKTSAGVDLFVNGMSDVCIVLSVSFTSSVAGAANVVCFGLSSMEEWYSSSHVVEPLYRNNTCWYDAG
jgi:hypothetical protein